MIARAPSRLLRLCTAIALACAAACIERPWPEGSGGAAATPGSSAPRQFDRNSVRDALISQLPPEAIPVGAVFGGGAVELAAWRVEPPALAPGQRARITLFWRCKRELEPWHIFVHLDDATGGSPDRIHAEHDPVQGRFPTEAWKPGDLIADAFIINAGQVPLSMFVGFYNQGESRLQLDSPGRGRGDDNNRLFVGNIPLVH